MTTKEIMQLNVSKEIKEIVLSELFDADLDREFAFVHMKRFSTKIGDLL